MAYNNAPGLIVMGLVLFIFSFLLVGLRILSRCHKAASLLADDWLIAASLVFTAGHTGLLLYGCLTQSLGVRMEIPPLPPQINVDEAIQIMQSTANPYLTQFQAVRKIDLAFFAMVPTTICLIKCSVACLYGRIFVTERFRIVIGVWITLIVLFGIAMTVSIFAVCGSHLSAFFEVNTIFAQNCYRYWPLGVSYQAIDVAMDLATILLPLPMIYKLQMPERRKLTVLAIFLIGLVSLGSSVASAAIWLTQTRGEWQAPPKGDPFVISTSIIVWNLVEIHSGIIAACLPTLRPLLADERIHGNIAKWFGLSSFPDNLDASRRSQNRSWPRRSVNNSLRTNRFSLMSAGVDKPTAERHNEPLPDDIELASNEFYMRTDVEIIEQVTPELN